MNWSQISKEIPLSLVIISHREWDDGEDGMEKKGGGSQVLQSVLLFNGLSTFSSVHLILS